MDVFLEDIHGMYVMISHHFILLRYKHVISHLKTLLHLLLNQIHLADVYLVHGQKKNLKDIEKILITLYL